MGHAFTLHYTVLLSQGGLLAHLGGKKGQGQGFTANLKWFFDRPGFGTGLLYKQEREPSF